MKPGLAFAACIAALASVVAASADYPVRPVGPNLLVVSPALPVTSVPALIALARARPGELNYASAGTGATNHLAAELFKAMAGVDIVRIGYKGAGPALNDVIANQVQVMFPTASAGMPHVKAGRAKALAVTSRETSAVVPQLPTVAASGLPGYESLAIYAVFVPARTPRRLVERLNREIGRILESAEIRERLFALGMEAKGGAPADLAATIASEMTRMGKVIRAAGIRAAN